MNISAPPFRTITDLSYGFFDGDHIDPETIRPYIFSRPDSTYTLYGETFSNAQIGCHIMLLPSFATYFERGVGIAGWIGTNWFYLDVPDLADDPWTLVRYNVIL